MKMNKKLLSLILSCTLCSSLLVGCNNKDNLETSSVEKVKTIGISQLVAHPALDKAREGFIEALSDNGYRDGENIKIDYQNSQNDMPTTQTIASKFVSDKVDLIYAISTPSAQAAYNSTKDIPILISAVTDPVAAGLLKSIDNPDENLSGTSDKLSIDNQLELVKLFVPKAKNIGVIYSTSEVNSKIQVDELKEIASKKNYNIIEKGVSSSNELTQAMSSLSKDIDVLYVPTDNLIVSSMPIISKIANENKIPVIASEEGAVKSGALACKGIDYNKLGYQTGEMAVKVLQGKDINSLPIGFLNETQVIINEDTLNLLSLEKPIDIDALYVKTEN